MVANLKRRVQRYRDGITEPRYPMPALHTTSSTNVGGRDMAKSTRTVLLETVANLLIERAVGDADFFADLAKIINQKGYVLWAEHRGIQGTHLHIEKVNEEPNNATD